MGMIAVVVAAAVSVDFGAAAGKIRPELHSSGFGPQICSCPQSSIDAIKSMGFKASRTHDWALINPNQRVCDYFHIFPLMHLDAKDPKNYVFGPTDYLFKRTREELGHEIFFRLGTSIEHSGPRVHFNTLIPDDFDKVAEVFAGTMRHYNRGWANGHEWGIKYWEIWNEPDGFNNMWCLPDGDGGRGATPEEEKADYRARTDLRNARFAKFFVTCLKRLKAEFPEAKIGGPALCSMNTNYFGMLFRECKAAGVAPDFISWHHYTSKPEVIMGAVERGRSLCDSYGFKSCELIVDEWHYFGDYSWADLRSPDPEILGRVWSGPASHNGIDSSCFNLTMLTKFQSSALDQAYYYGCRNIGSWGFMDERKQKYKVYYGLKMFGDFIKGRPEMCRASSEDDGVSVIAAKGADGSSKAFIVADYRSKAREIVVDVKGVAPDAAARVTIHDHERDLEPAEARLEGGRLVLEKKDENSAAFLVEL